ncbi:MAG: tRNA lysidine(34) synthetase TilS [Lachnospiraceae bacterium]|nr:tRNA lysidine(34) synthetase TilS [Lachnospiraceae bacterium]
MNNLLLAKIKQYINQNALLQKGDFVLVGFSGGADSVALLSILYELKEEYELTLHALHVNHCIRGQEAKRDELFCKEFCKVRGIEFKAVSVDVPLMASNEKLTLEEAGRAARYEAFEKYMQENSINKLALAHHKDDLAETCLFNMARGSKLAGLRGIIPLQKLTLKEKKLCVIRPLLCVQKSELIELLKEENEAFVTDSTNFENDYSRNRIRNLIIPELKKVNANAVNNIFEMSAYISEVDTFIDEMAEDIISKYVVKHDDRLEIKAENFSSLKKILREKVLYKCLCEIAGRKKDIEAKHVLLLDNLFEMSSGKSLDLCYGICAEKSFGTVIIGKKQELKQEKEEKIKINKSEITSDKGVCVAPNVNLKLIENMWTKDELLAHIPKNNKNVWFDFDKLKFPLEYRKICDEDYICIYQDGRKKSLTQLFDSYKIPKYDRERMCFAIDKEVLFVPGVRSCETLRVSEKTKLILEIKTE